MKYIAIVQTKNGQRQVQIEAPKVDLNMLISHCMESLKNLFNL